MVFLLPGLTRLSAHIHTHVQPMSRYMSAESECANVQLYVDAAALFSKAAGTVLLPSAPHRDHGCSPSPCGSVHLSEPLYGACGEQKLGTCVQIPPVWGARWVRRASLGLRAMSASPVHTLLLARPPLPDGRFLFSSGRDASVPCTFCEPFLLSAHGLLLFLVSCDETKCDVWKEPGQRNRWEGSGGSAARGSPGPQGPAPRLGVPPSLGHVKMSQTGGSRTEQNLPWAGPLGWEELLGSPGEGK